MTSVTLPLQGRRILVTRPKNMSSAVADLLASLGATPILIPTIALIPPPSCAELDAALHDLRSFSLVVFTSASAVQAFAARAALLKVQPRPRRVAVIGPATASAVQGTGITPDDPTLIMPPQYVAESLAETLLPHAPGARILLPRAFAAREVLPETLRRAGAEIVIADAYQTIIPQSSLEALNELFDTDPPDAIMFTSASTAQNFAALLHSASQTVPFSTTLASIGPITSQAMRELNLFPTIQALESTIPGLIHALKAHFERPVN
jgi:uroporphyrinogen-III synthase